jgi:tetratricopeptide (TPR) repeat protein
MSESAHLRTSPIRTVSRPGRSGTAATVRGLVMLSLATTAMLVTSGCNEVRGRRLIQEGNELFKDAKFPEAVKKFEEAEAFIPNFPTLWLNKGFTCKRMIIPGSKSPENEKAADCAIKSFDTFRKLVPEDNRGDMLYTQTLFDADRFEQIVSIYKKRFEENPKDQQAVSILMQVHSKWDLATIGEGGKLDEALRWYEVYVEQRPDDPEAYYAVGTFLYTQLNMKGGGPDKMCWDPRKNALNKEECRPADKPGDLVGAQRVDMADKGISFLEKAIALRPTYTDAMTYINLLWRQRAYGLFPVPDEWWASMQKAEEWKVKTLEILKQRGVSSIAVMPREAIAGVGQSKDELENQLAGDDEEKNAEEAAPAGASEKKPPTGKKKSGKRKGKR